MGWGGGDEKSGEEEIREVGWGGGDERSGEE